MSRDLPISDLLALALRVEGHVTIHANYSPTASRYPDPDWACQLLWVHRDEHGHNPQPASLYGTGPNLADAAEAALDQLPPEPPQETPA